MELHSRKPLPKASDIQLIVCDVDGTPPVLVAQLDDCQHSTGTLLDSQHRLSPTSPTHTILRRIRSTYRDLPIVISTGKTYHATAELRLQLDLSPFPASHHNGNLIYAASGEIIHESVVSPVVVDEVYAACRAIGASLFITDRDRAYHVLPVKTFTDEQVARLKRGLGEEVVELARAEESMRRVRTGDLKVFSMAVVEAPSYLACAS
jgi:hydroxymethylpyrimidine pyrophosphatase-like HAD family hydrolase